MTNRKPVWSLSKICFSSKCFLLLFFQMDMSLKSGRFWKPFHLDGPVIFWCFHRKKSAHTTKLSACCSCVLHFSFHCCSSFHWSLFQEVLKCSPILKSGRITRTRRIFNILFCSLKRAHGKHWMLQLTWSHAEALGVEPMAQFAVLTPAKTCHNGTRVTNQQSLSHKKIWAENQFREVLSHKQPHNSQILP